jgi:uncharacterized phage protein (TIGR02220 family)
MVDKRLRRKNSEMVAMIGRALTKAAGHDSAVGEMKVKGMRNFTNKVWNASRFIKLKQEEMTNDKLQVTNQAQKSGIINFHLSISKEKEFKEHLNQVITEGTEGGSVGGLEGGSVQEKEKGKEKGKEEIIDVPAKAEKIDFEKLKDFINQKTGRNFKVINKTVKGKYLARLKDGYSKQDILDAVSNSIKSDYHKGENFKYLTPEFFSRSETLDKYSNVNNKPKENNVKSLIPKGVSFSGPQY